MSIVYNFFFWSEYVVITYQKNFSSGRGSYVIYFKCFGTGSQKRHFRIKQHYLNLVVLPQGVRGYLIDFVLPPCGWSTGLRATPRTLDFNPKDLQKPLLVQAILRLSLSAHGPKTSIEQKEKNLRTPEGSLTSAAWWEQSNFIIFAEQPALRAY